MVHMASSRKSLGDEAKYISCIRLFYPNFVILVVLGHNSSLVTSFPINKTPRVGGNASIHPSLSHPLAIFVF
jgi:hypothetical protein